MDVRAAWEALYARDPAPWRAGRPPPLDRLELPLGARVLDVGAGGGKTTAAARALGWRTLPLDPVRRALPPGGLVGDGAHLPFRAGAFDGVLLVHVLGHLPDPALVVAEAERVLRGGGGLLAVVFGRGDARSASGRVAGEHVREREGIPTRYFEEDEVRALLPGCDVRTTRAPARWGVREQIVAVRRARSI